MHLKLTKKRRHELAREVIDRNVIGVPFSVKDTAELNHVLGTDFIGFERRHNPRHPSDPRHLYRQDLLGWESISWNKCISPISETAQFKAVMRDAIAPCVAEAREVFVDMLDSGCEHCGATSHLQVDHIDPSFDEIANEWLKSCKPEIQPHQSGSGWVFTHTDVEAHWIAFHAARAKYQMLCRSCNASKGKRGMAFLRGSGTEDLFT